jgi:hypothetical protein
VTALRGLAAGTLLTAGWLTAAAGLLHTAALTGQPGNPRRRARAAGNALTAWGTLSAALAIAGNTIN